MTIGIELRNARDGDVAGMVHVESLSWPAELAADEQQIAKRIETFPVGQWVAVSADGPGDVDGRIVGTVYAQRITTEFLDTGPTTYDHLTDRGTLVASHDPDGDIYHLIGVGVLPEFKGGGLGRQLVNQQIAAARTLPGIRRILGFTRPAAFHRHPQRTIEEYAQLCDDEGQLVDPVLSFHIDNGARIVSFHAAYRPEDEPSRGYGVLIEYAL